AAVANSSVTGLVRSATAYFDATERFRIARFSEMIRSIPAQDYFDGAALARANDLLALARRRIAESALRAHPGSQNPGSDWLDSTGTEGERLEARIQDLAESGETTLSRLTVAAGLLHDLAELGKG